MNQEISKIDIEELVLWTENPRDPINENAKDQDIVDRALEDGGSKWTLKKLAEGMGDYYDLSELPTVVYKNGKPIVYDGNRRMILAKIQHGLVSVGEHDIRLPEIPKLIDCNVCDEETALNNVLRKHGDSGSWQPLERDYFLHKFMGREKSSFLVLEEETQLISSHPHLNQRFVKEEVFKDDNLESMGFEIKNNKLRTKHTSENAKAIFSDISQKIKDKKISTRKHRGNVVEVLDSESKKLIRQGKGKKYHASKIAFNADLSDNKSRRRSKRLKVDEILFGEKLILREGVVNDLYRDICDLYEFYRSKKDDLSKSFPSLIRMSLRLFCEAAAIDKGTNLDDYTKSNFESAKATLNQDQKTTLANHNVKKETLLQLLHTGAHKYKAASNLEQTIAVSIIIAAIIKMSHERTEK